MRIRSIDVFRGFSIVLMVFFSLILRIGKLPDILVHNISGSLHFGDFVLPMFLFASGISLVFFNNRRKNLSKTDYALDVAEKFGKLVLISALLSVFSAGDFLGMDEVMLNALLFIPAVILLTISEVVLGILCVLIFGIYFALMASSNLPDFSLHYLGGYTAAFFYLPVMLGGVIVGKRILNGQGLHLLLLATAIISAALFALIIPDKMNATPTFMALSVFVSLAFFIIVDWLLKKQEKNPIWNHLEYLGKDPIRYWVLMFVVLIIPISLYAISLNRKLPLDLGWEVSLIIGLLCVPFLYVISKGVDRIKVKITKR
ncbi:DUF1624 domain-containing protein [Candidatus Micrarchaeota archaeon]|nr:DUF1624 domain-containing protein [Candidatus Micrarchaeota archaeon]